MSGKKGSHWKNKRDPIDRFWENVEKSDGDGCWEWKGQRAEGGYGTFHAEGKNHRSHRWIFQYIHGKLSRKKFVCHKCDNPPCVRPDHLFAGTSKQNSQDASRKGRLVMQVHPEKHPRGELHPTAKLTWIQVVEIRNRFSDGEDKTVLAKVYGVSRANIRSIVNRKTWRETL